jgi:hypothetical protein
MESHRAPIEIPEDKNASVSRASKPQTGKGVLRRLKFLGGFSDTGEGVTLLPRKLNNSVLNPLIQRSISDCSRVRSCAQNERAFVKYVAAFSRHSSLSISAICVRTPLSRPNWSRRLPRPLIIPGVMKIATLADVRVLIE